MATTQPTVAQMTDYIRQVAAEEGIDPAIALKVARSEGLKKGVWQATGKLGYGRERSYGPFQLHVAPKGHSPGVGNAMIRDTGLNPADPKNWREGIRYGLRHAKKHGWDEWMGAAKVGVKGKMGIGMNPKTKPPGVETVAKPKAAPSESATFTDRTEDVPDAADVEAPEMEDYPDTPVAAEAPDEDYPEAADEGPSQSQLASKQLMTLGQGMMADADPANFDYTPAGESQLETDAPYDSGIPTDYYRQYMTEFAQEGGEVEDFGDDLGDEPEQYADDEMTEFAQEGGEVEGFSYDPEQFIDDDEDEGLDPNEYFRSFGET